MPALRTPLALALALAILAALAACGSASTDPTDQTSASRVKPGRVAVAVSPAAVTVPAGGTVAFTARVSGAKNGAVTWSLREPTGCGSIAASGLYTAPGAAASCHVIATSVADPTASAEAAATVTAPPPAPPPSPVAVTVPQVVVTVAVNWALAPGVRVVVPGETATPRIRSVTATATVAFEVGAAWLVATTW